MKAKEQIWLGDFIVVDGDEVRRMTSVEWLSNKISVKNIALANANVGAEVVICTESTVFEI